MEHPGTQSLYGYWNDLRAGRDAPFRSEIDPRRIRGALETMFILETTPEGGLRFRLAGTRLCELAGRELRGLSAESLMIFGHERELTTLAARALGEPGVGVMRLRAEREGGFGGESFGGELVLLPMRSELGDMNRILGAVNLNDLPRRGRGPEDLRLRCLGARTLPIEIDPDLFDEEGAPRRPSDPTDRPARTASIVAGGGFGDPSEPFARSPHEGLGHAGPVGGPVGGGRAPVLVAIEGNPRAAVEKVRSRGHLRVVRD